MKPVLLVGFHGLLFKGGLETYIEPALAAIENVESLGVYSWREWPYALDYIRDAREEYSAVVAYGHSLGAASASYLTDYTKIDQVFLIDPAGAQPSSFGKNTGSVFDFQDTAFAIVPKYRAKLVSGQPASKLKHLKYFSGHMGITYNQNMVDTMVWNIQWLGK